MDVKFFEHQSYFPKTEIQGENSREYQLWDKLQDTQSNISLPRRVTQTSLHSNQYTSAPSDSQPKKEVPEPPNLQNQST